MSESNRNHIATLFIIVACMVFFLILTGMVFLSFGNDGVRTVLSWSGYIAILAVVLGILAIVVLLVAWIFNLATRNFVNIQVSNDKADVAKFGALKESMRGQNDYERDVRRHALPVARMLAKPTQTENAPIENNAWYDEDEDVDADYRVLE